jgi:plastocyanin
MITALFGTVLLRSAAVAVGVSGVDAADGPVSRMAATVQGPTGRIEGKVQLVMPPSAALPSGVYPARRVSRPAPKTSEIANVIVFLKDVPRSAELAATHTTIEQKDEAFVPRVVAITRGSIVNFPNADPYFHNVFSLSRGASFDLGRYPRGDTRSRRFTTAGLVKVFCHIHSHMTASIMVFDHPYFRIPSADGSFAIDDVPPGTYQVSAWHERIGESISPLRVDAGRTARIEFVLPVEQE